ncbi:MAG: HPr family phosphocarrier protein [Gammaproteobacteria bacterium]|nr:HPr family phosphocarrier protein [Gammaproteobacteria bacterium]
MQTAKVKIVNRLGLHARAAANFVSRASAHPCDVRLQRGGRHVNGKSIMGVMMLAAACGMEIEIVTEGEGEELAIEDLCELVANGFGEI